MMKNNYLNDEELEVVHGGTRPEDIGEPILLANGVVSYRVCEKCGAAMFPVKVRSVGGSMIVPIRPDYQCSECDNRHVVVRVK